MVRRGVRWVLFVAVLVTAVSIEGSSAGAETVPPPFFTAWGTGGSGDGQLSFPFGVAVGGDGDVYVADTFNDRIQRFSSTGTYLGQWGTEGTGDGQLDRPIGVAVAGSGDVYVADARNDRVQRFSSTGTYLDQWGTDGTGDGQFSSPYAVAIDGDGSVLVADSGNSRIQRFTSTGTYLDQWGTEGSASGQLSGPRGIAVDGDGTVYVVDSGNSRIQTFTSTGTPLAQWGVQGSGDGEFEVPIGIAVDPSTDTVYVADAYNQRVQAFTAAGAYLTQWGEFGNGPGQFSYSTMVAVDGTGGVYVTDNYNHRVQVFGHAPPFAPAPALTATLSGPGVVMVGDEISYELDVTNDGNVALTGVRAVDGAVPDCEDVVGLEGGVLDVGTQASLECSHPTTADDVGPFRHWALVTSDQHASDTTNVVRTTVAAPRPDGLIRRTGSSASVGNGIYNTNGARQGVTRAAARGATASFDVTVANDSAATDSFTLRGSGTPRPGYTVTWFRGGSNITAPIVAGTYAVTDLVAGGQVVVQARVRVGAAAAGSSVSRTLTITSTSPGVVRDTVKATVTRA